MTHDVPRGAVLILSDRRESADRLYRWVEAAGEDARLTLLDGGPIPSIPAVDEVDLVVTDLDTDEPDRVRLMRELLEGQRLPGVPRLHLLRDSSTLRRLREVDGPTAAIALAWPPDEELFRTRVTLTADLGRMRRALSRATIRDPLTGCFNRRFVSMRLEQEFARARRYRTPLSIVLLSVDHLRSINEGFGQRVGDAALTRVAELLEREVRREDIHGRWGTKSFAALLPGAPYRGAAIFSNKVRGDSETLVLDAPDGPLPVRLSVGIASFGPSDEIHSPADLIRSAETALVEARRRGGNRVFIDEATVRSERRLVLIADRDPEWLNVIEDLLGLADYRVVRAESARTIAETVRYRRPDLAIVDTRLLDDEPSLLGRLTDPATGAPFPLIAVAPQGDAVSAMPGVDRYLTRPFSPNVLPTLGRDLISHAAAAAAGSRAV